MVVVVVVVVKFVGVALSALPGVEIEVLLREDETLQVKILV